MGKEGRGEHRCLVGGGARVGSTWSWGEELLDICTAFTGQLLENTAHVSLRHAQFQLRGGSRQLWWARGL